MLHFNKIINARLNALYHAQNVKFVVIFHRIILLDSRISLTIMIQRTSVSLMIRQVENLQAISHRASANRPLKCNIRLHSTRRFCKQLYDPAGTRRKNSRRASGDTQYHYLRIRTKSDKRQNVEKNNLSSISHIANRLCIRFSDHSSFDDNACDFLRRFKFSDASVLDWKQNEHYWIPSTFLRSGYHDISEFIWIFLTLSEIRHDIF